MRMAQCTLLLTCLEWLVPFIIKIYFGLKLNIMPI